MKRTTAVFLAIILAFSVLAVIPAAAEVNVEWEYLLNDDGETATIVKYTGSETDVTIPGEIDGHTVTRLSWKDTGEDFDFYGMFEKNVEKVTIPDTVTTIGIGAFTCCSTLKEVTIPDSVVEIEEYAFLRCTSLKSVVIPDSVTRMGYQTFESCASLESVVIPDGVTSLGPYLFVDCPSLKSVTVGKGTTQISLAVFKDCTSLKSVELPEGLEEIWEDAFEGCTALEKVYYAGSKEEWNKINIESEEILNAEIIFAIPSPDDATTSGDESTPAGATGVKTAPQTGDVTAAVVVLLFAALYISAVTIAKKKKER